MKKTILYIFLGFVAFIYGQTQLNWNTQLRNRPNITRVGANATWTDNVTISAGQNQIVTFSSNGTRHLDGNKYVCSAVGLASAITDASTTGNNIVDGRDCNPGSTPFTSTINIPAGVTVQLGAPWICGVASAPCFNITGSGATLTGIGKVNTQILPASQATNQFIIRAGAGVTSTTDLLAINNNPTGAIEEINISGVLLDWANTSSTTGRHCLTSFGASHVYLSQIYMYNCGADGLHVESTPYHSYDLTLANIRVIAAKNNGYMLMTPASIQQIVGNGVTATVTSLQICPANGTSITISQNSQAGFNGTFTTTGGTGTNSCTFSSGTNATGTGGFYSYIGLADIDRVDCTSCIYYAYNAGTITNPFASYAWHLLAGTAANNCSTQNCNTIADVNLRSGFIQGVASNASNAGFFVEDTSTLSNVSQIYWQGEIEDSFNSNLGTGWKVTSQNNTTVSNISVRSAGFANFTTSHNMVGGGSGNVWNYETWLTPVNSPEFGTFRFRPQTLPGAITVNPNCGITLISQGAGSYCWYLRSDGTWRYAKTDTGPSDLIVFDGQNNRVYPATSNNYKLGDHTVSGWSEVSAFNIYLGATLLVSGTAPTIAAGGCGGSAASISTQNGTAAFDINVGTTPTSGGCTVTMPTASNRWNCSVNDFTTISTGVFVQKQTASSATSVTFVNYSDVAVATAPSANDIFHVQCSAE